jgi:uncharacterized protein (TIGR02246 family)
MSAQQPEEIRTLFSTAFNAGNLDALMALYEPEAMLIPQPGKVTRGRDAIRHALQQFLALKGTMQLQSLYVINGPGIALMSSQWKLTGSDPDGKSIEMNGKGVEVARQQPSGDWLLAVDHPFGAD